MNEFSDMNGAIPVSPVSSGVWKIAKKRKTRDERNRRAKKRKGDTDAENEDKDLVTLTGDADLNHDEACEADIEDQGEEISENQSPEYHKIDLKI